ncbi:MAG: S-layer homology domain-containing protein [Actinomycetes bacterium]
MSRTPRAPRTSRTRFPRLSRAARATAALLGAAALGAAGIVPAQAAETYSLSGTVTLPASVPPEALDAIQVQVRSVDWWTEATVSPDATGAYVVDGLPQNDYVVEFLVGTYVDPDTDLKVTPDVVGEYWGGAYTYYLATQVPVGQGANPGDVTGIDAELERGRTIAGTVTLAPSADPALLAQGIEVFAEPVDAGISTTATATVDPATGAYQLTGLKPGEYILDFDGAGEGADRTNVIWEFYANALTREDATPVNVTAGDVSGVNAQLAQGRTITGALTVEDGADPAALQGVQVMAFGPTGTTFGVVDPEAGTYLLSGLVPGEYTVEFSDSGYTDPSSGAWVASSLAIEYLENRRTQDTANVIDVSGSSVESDVKLELARTISGTVTLAPTLDPREADTLHVHVVDPVSKLSRTGWVRPDGTYAIPGLPPGEYTVRFYGEGYWDDATGREVSRVQSEYWDDAETLASATAVDLTAGDARGIDAELAERPRIEFTDVDDSAFTTEIQWLADEGISTGYPVSGGQREYRPLGRVTRDAMAAFLYRFAGSPHVDLDEGSPFVDVPTSHPFYEEIVWLAQTEVTTGWAVPGGREFRPSRPITRDAMAAFLYRFAGSPSWEAPSIMEFDDITPSTPFFHEITWLAETKISTGWTVGRRTEFRPLENIKRDAMAAFLYRYAGLGLGTQA